MDIRKREGFQGEHYLLLPIKAYPEFTHHQLVNENYITEIGYYPNAQYHFRERLQGVAENIFLFCLAGEGTVELLGSKPRTIVMTAGTVFTIPAHTPHRYYASKAHPWTLMWFHFSSNVVNALPGFERCTPITVSASNMRRIQNHFVELLTLLTQKMSLGNLVCASNYLTLILAETYLTDGPAPADHRSQLISGCILFMRDHLSESLSLSTIAKHAEISISYLNQLFNLYTGKSPIDYLIGLKVEQACNYIKLTDLKFYEIAERVGYHDQFYFSKLFKQVIGQSPTAYRKNVTSKSQM